MTISSVPQEETGATGTETDLEDDECTHLHLLTKEELVHKLQTCHRQLSRANKFIKIYTTRWKLLTNKRDIIFEALTLIDSIASLDCFGEETPVNSIGTSAIDKRIDTEWEDHCNKSKPTKKWRNSTKSRDLRSVAHSPESSISSEQEISSSSQATIRRLMKEKRTLL